jgi:hypothetical protein
MYHRVVPNLLAALLLALASGCKPRDRDNPEPGPGPGGSGVQSLAEARKGFATKLKKPYKANEPVDEPPGKTHFSILAPVNKLVAQKVVADTGAETNLAFTEGELNKSFGR